MFLFLHRPTKHDFDVFNELRSAGGGGGEHYALSFMILYISLYLKPLFLCDNFLNFFRSRPELTFFVGVKLRTGIVFFIFGTVFFISLFSGFSVNFDFSNEFSFLSLNLRFFKTLAISLTDFSGKLFMDSYLF